ncbi:MAG: c-type cytochrome [Bacteroidota bacterium]
MKHILFFSSLFIFASCGDNKPAQNADGTPNGQQIYEDNCSICHGGDGKLGVNGAKDLAASTMSKEEALAIIAEGKGKMTPFKELLDEKQREAVAEYIQTLKTK